MNDVNPESKLAVIKTLAILGFLTAIIVAVWAAVQVVRLAPSAWMSLASIAETVYGKNVILTLSVDKNIVNSGEAFAIHWNDVRKPGTYTFSYACIDGVAAEVKDASGQDVALSCDTETALPEDAKETDVTLTSEKKRFVDANITVRFKPQDTSVAAQEKTQLMTVVNATIPGVVATSTDAGEDTEDNAAPKPSQPVVTPAPSAPSTPTQTTPKPSVHPTGPVSNPNGNVDLKVSFLGVGTWDADTKKFTAKESLSATDKGAVRFSVANAGSKTSGSWVYIVTLPGDESVSYTSEAQAALVPTETAFITIAFEGLDAKADSLGRLKVSVASVGDTNAANNTLDWAVNIAK